MSAREQSAAPISERLAEGRGRAREQARPGGARGLLALQRAAGNSAVSALLAGKLRSSGDSVADIDKALSEVRGSEPDIAIVEKGLKATKAAGVQVDLEGEANKPPASALAVTTTGFGPGAVAPKKPVPPPKPVKPVSPLGKAGAKAPKPAGPSKGAAKGGGAAGKAPAIGGGGGAATAPAAPAPLTSDKLLQPPVPPPGVTPAKDPAFAQVKGNVKGFANAKKAHQPAASKAKEAQEAALAPTDDVSGQAKAAKVDAMDAQQPGTFDKKAFIAAVKAAIEAKSPKTLKEADSYKESGKAGEVKGEVKGMATQGKEGSAKDIEAATEAAPDQSKAVPKEVTPLKPEDPGKPAPIPASGAVPKPAPAEQTNLAAGKHEVNQEMADAQVSDEQLAKSNEPEFQGALADKQKAAEHADKGPAEFREQEKATLTQSKEEANAQTAAGVSGMQGAKGAALAKVVAAKGQTKSKDETERAKVTAKIQEIFAATEAEVKKILEGIDPKVEAAFEQGEAAARAKFEAFVSAKMSAYKRDRYGGWLGGLRWAKDKLLGMPDKVNEFYTAGRELYLKEMDGVISRVADIVGGDLNAAKQRIAKGRADIAAYVKTLSPNLQKVGNEAAKDISDKFDQLESDVNDKQNAVVETLASKYVEARKGLDERIEALQAENKGLVDKAIGAIKGVIDTIRNLADMLKNVLARAASAIGDIIKDPVGFLGNLIGAVKGGITKFFSNIGAHLKKGLTGWLFGQLGDAGIEIPDTFDIKGVIKLLASVFGLTWANIRNRIVKQIGEKAMAAIEAGVDIFQKIASGGLGAVWEMLMEKLGDIKKMIMDQIEDFVLTRIITAGITWLISLLNPAAAFIKACKLIYDVVMFFVNNAERILKFVNTVIDGIVDIVKGNVSSVVDKIEDALSQMVPILIGFIASALGIGGIGEKIKSILQALQKPVNKALDFVIKQGLKLAGPIIRGIQGIGAKAKAKVAAGKAWVKGKIEKGKEKLLGKLSPADVKAQARRMLSGKAFKTDAEAKQGINAVYSALAPKGLKALQFIPGAPGKPPAVLATASPAERIELATTPAEVIRIALTMQMFTGRTTAYVTYSDGCRFGPANGYTNRGGHAELRIAKDVPRLQKAIERDKKRGVIPNDPKTPVTIDMNRLPCDHCSERLHAAFSAATDLQLRVNASSVWKQHTGGIELSTAEGLGKLSKVATIQPLHIWPLIERKLRSFGIKEVQVGRTVYDIDVWLNLNAAKNGVGAFDVEDKLAELNSKKLHGQKVGG